MSKRAIDPKGRDHFAPKGLIWQDLCKGLVL